MLPVLFYVTALVTVGGIPMNSAQFTKSGITAKVTSPGKQSHIVHRDMTKREVEKIFGVDSHQQVPEYDVILPVQSDESGNVLSHNRNGYRRIRKGAKQQQFSYFKVQAFSTSLLLNVTKTNLATSSGALVHTIHQNGSSSYNTLPSGSFYSGHVVSNPGSLVALGGHGNSGLAGIIRCLEETFIIHPLPSHLAKNHWNVEGHAHVIYRRSLDDLFSDCHYPDDESPDGKATKTVEPLNKRRKLKGAVPHKFLEMALVADDFAIKSYGEKDMVYHLLTLAHLVTALYHDSSIGPIKITPVVVRVVLNKDGFGYDSTANKGKRINALERWARQNLPKDDKDPGHADVVVLITKKSSGGIASSGSTCVSSFGAALSNDIGLGSAIVVAHEVAHTMKVPHDGQSSMCPNHLNIMASVIPSGPGSMKWSICSREKFQEFLSFNSACLDDLPPLSSIIPVPKDLHDKLPGQIMDRHEQCEMIYGLDFHACPQFLGSCGALGCTDDGYSCSFTSTSPADGTRCGDRKWCISGACVDDGSLIVDGGWSSWSVFSTCSRHCGGGIQSKTRTCTNPKPQNGGENCTGPAQGQWKVCNPQPCPIGSKSFRQIQCEEIDPDYKAHYTKFQCLLACIKWPLVFPQGKPVKDGTRCTADPTNRDVCVQGRCMNVGCDNVLESGIKRDRCGICGGDSSSCKLETGTWYKKCSGFGADKACVIFDVPVGATSVHVEQLAADKNLLGVKDKDGEYVIPIPRWSTTKYVAGTKVYYYHEEDKDINTIYIPGPTNEKLTIVFVPGYPHEGVFYTFYDPRQKLDVTIKDVLWHVGSWSHCTITCAEGSQKRTVECLRKDDNTYVGDRICLQKSKKPATKRSCNTQPCESRWYTSDWTPCTKTCGKGMQEREIICRQQVTQTQFQTLADSSCAGEKPAGTTRRSCNEINCSPQWFASHWSECSSTCRGGVTSRSLYCQRLNDQGRIVPVHEVLCYHASKPSPTKRDCNSDISCPITGISVKYKGLGCFKDGEPNAVPNLVANFRSDIDWSNIQKTVNKCAVYVHTRFPKNKVFSIQFFGECWTGESAENSYGIHGKSNNCWHNVGGENTNYVYEFE